ncbi:MAG: YHS domain-containing protein [Candidatus Aminicenantes bacterium]|nr:MAG: YHS domain-containing protein [Candidatus Aminicenantes bacterium]
MKHSKILVLFLAFSFVLVVTGIAQEQAEETVVCPVSGKEVKKSEAKGPYEYEGKAYYFCCPNCKEAFMKSPEKYTQKKTEMKEVYTCPMHADVKSDKPGKCPKCGMKLEKKMMQRKILMHKEQEQMMHEEEKHDQMMHKKMMMQMMKMFTHMHKRFGKMACCAEVQMKTKEGLCCPLMGFKDADVKVENLDNGIALKITSTNKDVVKKIQEVATKLKSMCGQEGDCCKQETKKEEVKKK